MQYRRDIDGLRAVAVMSVICFHTWGGLFSGGYVGVDVFFVISGYLITSIVYKDVQSGSFSFLSFYKRRAARLLPALLVTLCAVLAFGFVFYNTRAFDNLGKEIFFSSVGAANILFSQGLNYFAKNEAYQPLLHLWSLGVEEQFYLCWPLLLLVLYRFFPKFIIPAVLFLFSASLFLSVSSVEAHLLQGYFLPQYRAFELLMGVGLALVVGRIGGPGPGGASRKALSLAGLALVVLPVFLLDSNSPFPGWNALWPCLGAAILIAFPDDGMTTRLLSSGLLVFVGLISYPLYLYHLPVVSMFKFFEVRVSPPEALAWTVAISVPLAWLTYRYMERPVRRMAHSGGNGKALFTVGGLVAMLLVFAAAGVGVAKSNGFEARFGILNPFAREVATHQATTFHAHFRRGFQVKNGARGRVLFVGDSLLQQYVHPLSRALGLDDKDVDTVTRGGCVLLDGVYFQDQFADISCNAIRKRLYQSEKQYDLVVISQAWGEYDTAVLNFPQRRGKYGKWRPFIDRTVDHFLKRSKKVLLIGAHPRVRGTSLLQPSISIDRDDFIKGLSALRVLNTEEMKDSRPFFDEIADGDRVLVLNPYDVFGCDQCVTHDDSWSYFSDNEHLSNAATDFVTGRLKSILSGRLDLQRAVVSSD